MAAQPWVHTAVWNSFQSIQLKVILPGHYLLYIPSGFALWELWQKDSIFVYLFCGSLVKILSHTEKGFRKYGEQRVLRCMISHMDSCFIFCPFLSHPIWKRGQFALLDGQGFKKGKRNNGNMIVALSPPPQYKLQPPAFLIFASTLIPSSERYRCTSVALLSLHLRRSDCSVLGNRVARTSWNCSYFTLVLFLNSWHCLSY